MSDSVKQIVEQAIEDEAFRELLFSNPDEALKDYELTDAEKQQLSGLNAGNFDEFAGELGDRTTRGWLPGSG